MVLIALLVGLLGAGGFGIFSFFKGKQAAEAAASAGGTGIVGWLSTLLTGTASGVTSWIVMIGLMFIAFFAIKWLFAKKKKGKIRKVK